MRELSAQYPRYGYRFVRVFLERDGHKMGFKRSPKKLSHFYAGLLVAFERANQAGPLVVSEFARLGFCRYLPHVVSSIPLGGAGRSRSPRMLLA